MDRTTTLREGSDHPADSLSSPVASKVENVARSAHVATDKIADAASSQIDRTRDTVHRAVDGAASAAQSTAGYASSVMEQAKQTQSRALDAASASIRARPITAVVGAIIAGYLLGRLARL